jgi:hypothetical protein
MRNAAESGNSLCSFIFLNAHHQPHMLVEARMHSLSSTRRPCITHPPPPRSPPHHPPVQCRDDWCNYHQDIARRERRTAPAPPPSSEPLHSRFHCTQDSACRATIPTAPKLTGRGWLKRELRAVLNLLPLVSTKPQATSNDPRRGKILRLTCVLSFPQNRPRTLADTQHSPMLSPNSKPYTLHPQASSLKPQASSLKPQASSRPLVNAPRREAMSFSLCAQARCACQRRKQ